MKNIQKFVKIFGWFLVGALLVVSLPVKALLGEQLGFYTPVESLFLGIGGPLFAVIFVYVEIRKQMLQF